MKTTTTNATQNRLEELQEHRNRLVKWLQEEPQNNDILQPLFKEVNAELVQTLSEIATYKTLKFLMSNNATNGQTTETTDNGQVTTYGYNMALKLFNSAYNDIKLMHNPHIITDILTDTADLIQESNLALLPYFTAPIELKLTDTIYTKTLKNGNEKNYNAFQFACKTIRTYITEQDKKQYKKMGYSLGFTNEGKQIITNKKPKNDTTDIEQEQKQNFINRYKLTELEKNIICDFLNNCNYLETMQHLNISKDMYYRTLKTAKEKILKQDKRIQFKGVTTK